MAIGSKHIPQSSIEIYTAPDNSIQLQVKLEKDTVWLTQDQMALLFGRDRTVIGRHIRNIYTEGELTKDITCAKFAHMGIDGDQLYEAVLYNLDVIISVGYRVKSQRGVQFRQWANKVLKEYLVKGYALRTNMQLKQYEELKQLVGVLRNKFTLPAS